MKRRKIPPWLTTVVSALFMAGLIALFSLSFTGGEPSEESMKKLEETVKRAAVQCYALEGAYPADAAYLEAHYGLVIDHSRFKVVYNSEMSNVMPIIKVIYLPPSYVEALQGGGEETP